MQLPTDEERQKFACAGYDYRRSVMATWKEELAVRRPDLALHRDLKAAWMIAGLVDLESLMWGRWNYWFKLQVERRLPLDPIPVIEFLGTGESQAAKMLEACLDCIPNSGSWRGWGSETYVRYFLEWLLYGFGHTGQPDMPAEPGGCQGASDRLYQVFNFGALLLSPYDYFGDLFAEMQYGRASGFFPTPMNVVQMMTMMLLADGGDHRAETVCDPCCGTGRMPLWASNYSLRLYGMDISPLMVLTTLVNGYLYAPWLVKPIAWLDERPAPPVLAEQMMELTPDHLRGNYEGSIHDAEEQWKYLPLVKRRRRDDDPPEFRIYPRFGLK